MTNSLSLKQIQCRLGVAQHVLIHLCEKGVITPEVADTEGRGHSREFSRKNLFEFAVALELRKYQIPVAMIAAIIRLLKAFEHSAQKLNTGFKLPDSLAGGAPQLNLWMFDGDLLVFQMAGKINLSFPLSRLLEDEVKHIRLEKLKQLPKDRQSCLQVDLSKIAKSMAV